jgi:hypothetical protein
MTKGEVDQIARKKPFEVRLVDGERWTFRSPEQFIVSRSAIHTLDRKGDGHLLSLPLISKIRILRA